jgi:hypothetical protein
MRVRSRRQARRLFDEAINCAVSNVRGFSGDDGRSLPGEGRRFVVEFSRPLLAQQPAGSKPAIRSLHERVLREDVSAVNKLAGELLATLRDLLRRRFPHSPEDFLNDAVEDAILDYLKHPERFDLSRGVPLECFLRLPATRNLANLHRSHARRLNRESAYAEESARCAATRIGQEQRAERTKANMTLDQVTLRQAALDVTESNEVAAVMVWLDAPRATARLAQALGMCHCSVPQQRRAVKRFKDRMFKRLRRHVVTTPTTVPTSSGTPSRVALCRPAGISGSHVE